QPAGRQGCRRSWGDRRSAGAGQCRGRRARRTRHRASRHAADAGAGMVGDRRRGREESSVSSDRQEMLDIVCRIAVVAGEAILKVYAEEFDVRHKTDKTPVTEADLTAEKIIVERLMSAFPDIPCVAEELCESEGMPPCCDRFWAIDPLDGTREFIARNGEFAVLIALVEDGRPVLGVVHGPAGGLTSARFGPGP